MLDFCMYACTRQRDTVTSPHKHKMIINRTKAKWTVKQIVNIKMKMKLKLTLKLFDLFYFFFVSLKARRKIENSAYIHNKYCNVVCNQKICLPANHRRLNEHEVHYSVQCVVVPHWWWKRQLSAKESHLRPTFGPWYRIVDNSMIAFLAYF